MSPCTAPPRLHPRPWPPLSASAAASCWRGGCRSRQPGAGTTTAGRYCRRGQALPPPAGMVVGRRIVAGLSYIVTARAEAAHGASFARAAAAVRGLEIGAVGGCARMPPNGLGVR